MKIPTSEALKQTVSENDNTLLATLNNQTAILADSPLTIVRGGKMLSVRGAIAIRNITAGDGPWLWGVCDAAINLSLLTGFLENAGPASPADQAKVEIASRGSKIRTIGHLVPVGNGTVASQYLDNHSLGGLRFTEEAAGWRWWLYNIGQQMTTGANWSVITQSFVQFNPSG